MNKKVYVAVGAAVHCDYWAVIDDVFVTESKKSAERWIELRKKKTYGVEYSILEREIENI